MHLCVIILRNTEMCGKQNSIRMLLLKFTIAKFENAAKKHQMLYDVKIQADVQVNVESSNGV